MPAMRIGLILCAVLVAGLVSPPARGKDSKDFLRIDIALSQRNLKQIGIAFHNFHNATLSMPANLATADGKPLLSCAW